MFVNPVLTVIWCFVFAGVVTALFHYARRYAQTRRALNDKIAFFARHRALVVNLIETVDGSATPEELEEIVGEYTKNLNALWIEQLLTDLNNLKI